MAVTKRCLSCAQTGIGFLNVRPNPTAVERLQVIVQNRNERLPATGVSAEIYRRIVRLWTITKMVLIILGSLGVFQLPAGSRCSSNTKTEKSASYKVEFHWHFGVIVNRRESQQHRISLIIGWHHRWITNCRCTAILRAAWQSTTWITTISLPRIARSKHTKSSTGKSQKAWTKISEAPKRHWNSERIELAWTIREACENSRWKSEHERCNVTQSISN